MHTFSVTARSPHAIVAALAALLAAIAAGCGGSAAAVPELSSFTNVAQTSSSADSARFSLDARAKIPGIGTELAVSADGGFDTLAKRSQMSVDLSSLAELIKSFGSSFGGKVTGDLGSPDDWKLDVILRGGLNRLMALQHLAIVGFGLGERSFHLADDHQGDPHGRWPCSQARAAPMRSIAGGCVPKTNV